MRRFLARFRGQQLEVALEATTGWRFVVEELQRIGAVVHLAEPADTAALKGNKKHAKNDRADARHLRELLMAGRLPESWIPPAHILDLRARVRLRHTLSIRAAWRVAAADPVGALSPRLPATRRPDQPRRTGMAGRAAVAARARASRSRSALAMIDALERQLAPLDKELRSYARRQPGCKALQRHYGIGAADRRSRSWPSSATPAASPPPEKPSASPAWTSPCTPPTSDARPATYPARDRQRCAGRCSKPRNAPGGQTRPTTPTTRRRPKRLGGNRACLVGRAQTAQTQLPHAARTRRGGPATRMTSPVRAKPFVTPMRRGQLPPSSCRHQQVDGHHRPSGRNASPSGITPSTIMSPTRNHPGSWTEIRLGARAHHIPSPRPRPRTTQPPSTPTIEPRTALDKRSVHR